MKNSSILLLIGLLLAACGKPPVPPPGASGPPGAGGSMPPAEVGVVTLVPERAEIVTSLPGRTVAFRVAEVRPQVSGIIRERLFTEGREVEKGQPLYQIDPATYQAEVENQRAAVARAVAAEEIARLLAARNAKLVQSRVISQQDYDDSLAAHRQAVADTAAARALRKAAEINLAYTTVRAPLSGRIGRSMVTEGALVTAEQATALATVQQLDPIYVDVTQPSTELLRLQRELADGALTNAGGQTAAARLQLEDGTDYREPGQLQFSEVSVDPGTGSVTLRAVFPNPRRELLPGMFVRASVIAGVNDHALLVSQQGVSRNPRGEPTALVVGAGNRVEPRTLKTDRVIGNRWLVTAGLVPGDRVILDGLQKIGPGAEVKPIDLPPPAPGANAPTTAAKN